MKETILLYHVNDEIKNKINEIATSLKIDIRIIEDDEIYETMGYLLKMEGYKKSIPQQVDFDMSQEFVFFAGMSDQQLDILLQLFKMNKIPPIPYKAMLTQHNINYTFVQLYQSVSREYHEMKQMNA
ncbi:MAG: DUF3783 domain-containing protein [Coprobacillus cateniformis]|uniref:DUF3783 domain-containing protein n=1 Tax=Longibaculum muris TaxID=1796628 RepID=UPI003AB7D4E8|nr:DUF3783 domain-containing protein [Coprobacillus cateniformis]